MAEADGDWRNQKLGVSPGFIWSIAPHSSIQVRSMVPGLVPQLRQLIFVSGEPRHRIKSDIACDEGYRPSSAHGEYSGFI